MSRLRQSGVSLLEALVALAVMAFGALGVLALQSSLRSNADTAKQRAEAVRLAQEVIEAYKGYVSLSVVSGKIAWPNIVTTSPTSHAGSNTTFSRTVTVVESGAGNDDPLTKTIHVSVTWTDRNNQAQLVELNTSINGLTPDLAGSLFVPADQALVRNPYRRQAGIPKTATDQGDGTSTFSPPGAGATRWVFDNATGYITQTCTGSSPATCTPWHARLVTGYVGFATGSSQPTGAMAEDPTNVSFAPNNASMAIDVKVNVTSSPPDAALACFIQPLSTYLAYYCGVPVANSGATWSGNVYVDPATISLATSVADTSASRFRVCRYTPVSGCHPAVGDTIWASPGSTASCTDPGGSVPSRLMTNEDHPLNYSSAAAPLVNQNYLIIRAGNGTVAFSCPVDDTATPLINGNTWHHQPSS